MLVYMFKNTLYSRKVQKNTVIMRLLLKLDILFNVKFKL